MATLTATADRQFQDEMQVVPQAAPFSKADALKLEFKLIVEREYHFERRAAAKLTLLAAGHAQGQAACGASAAQAWR